MTTVHRLEALAHGVLGPMVLGGKLHLVPPFGASLALGIDGEPRIVDDDLRTHVDLARVRVARTLLPVDTLGDIPAADWALAAAWNDLLQATNHHLSGVFTRGRHVALLRSVEAHVARIAAPRSIGEAVARHATFARALELVRTDTKVTWWSGERALPRRARAAAALLVERHATGAKRGDAHRVRRSRRRRPGRARSVARHDGPLALALSC